MPFRRPLCLSAAIVASAVAGCMTVSDALAPTSVTLATGTPGGVYHPVGSAIGRMLIALYPEAFTVVARADAGIRDFQDLRGKRVGIGTSGVGYNFTRDVILGFYGSTIPDPERVLEFAPAEQNQALCSNKVDAVIFAAGHPSGLTQEATTDCRARLVRVAGPPTDR